MFTYQSTFLATPGNFYAAVPNSNRPGWVKELWFIQARTYLMGPYTVAYVYLPPVYIHHMPLFISYLAAAQGTKMMDPYAAGDVYTPPVNIHHM